MDQKDEAAGVAFRDARRQPRQDHHGRGRDQCNSGSCAGDTDSYHTPTGQLLSLLLAHPVGGSKRDGVPKRSY